LGVDLLDFFRGIHPWPKFDRLVGQLGERSRYAKALSDDEDLARRVLAESGSDSEPTSKWRPANVEWSLMHELVAQQRDLMLKAWFKGGTAFPRPETALESLRTAAEEARSLYDYNRILDEVAAAQQRWRDGERPGGGDEAVHDDAM
jgi:hypothetical protein